MRSSLPKEKHGPTIQCICGAARKVFAEKGFAGARMDEIARMARVNKATIYYHIGDKRTLYDRILQDIFSGVADSLTQNDRPDSPPPERLRSFVRTLAGLVDKNADLAAIMLREQASGAKDFPERVGRDMARIIGLITDILQQGARAGVFKPATPVIVHLMTIGTLVFMKMSSPIRSILAGCMPEFKTTGRGLEQGRAVEIEDLILDAVRK